MKLRISPAIPLSFLIFLIPFTLKAEEVCESLARIYDFNTKLRIANCKAAYAAIDNKEAFKFTIQYFNDNYKKLADPTCAKESTSVQKGVLPFDTVASGIQNGCTMVLNDLETPYQKFPFRSVAYFIDLCAKDRKKAVRKFFMMKGVGSQEKGYLDAPEQFTTLAGAFLTNSKVEKFKPYKKTAKYEDMRIKMGGTIPKLRVIGLNNSNNSSEFTKPIHASPYFSSFGCPSVAPENAWVIEDLATRGPSLLMNYGPPELHKNTKVCDNESKTSNTSATQSSENKESQQ